ncbi:zinc ribbon domain-containing protein [uncultured Methanobrevibacter sp.]|uniref:double zinc ribbon domain-containing protein n=1 Tax=uncultured Methanobrevibacter sp. TaxID=253161 RepID=UPI0026132D4F|nr:zinc ribbon domain-containing protein [uncultured Methanobrevibacter sp.]
MKCPNYGAESQTDNEKFCRKCGTKLEIEVKKATIVQDSPKITCNSCGKSIDSNLKICPYCGCNPHSVSTYTSNSQTSGNSSDDSSCWSCCGLLVLIVIILYIIGLIF